MRPTTNSIRIQTTPWVFIVDDDAAMRDSLSELVTVMGYGTASFESAEDFLHAYEEHWTGCLILDVQMPGMSGIELHDRLMSMDSLLQIIVITGHGEISTCVDVIKKGAIDFLEKPYRPDELRSRIRDAVRQSEDKRQRQKYYRAVQQRFKKLSNGELDVLEGIVAGNRNSDIASQLDVSLRTVQLRRKQIMEKLNVQNRAELIRLAVWYAEMGGETKPTPENPEQGDGTKPTKIPHRYNS